MELSAKDITQYLDGLQIPEEMCDRCRHLAEEERYEELYASLRGVRPRFLDDMHTAQNRLDQLDLLIYDVKKKREDN